MRRRSTAPSVSFFSFQDLMTGTIGVMILIVLVLVLWLTQVVDSVAAMTATGASSEAHSLDDLRGTVGTLEERLAEQRLTATSNSETAGERPERRIAQLRQALRELYGQTKQREEEIAMLTEHLQSIVSGEQSSDSTTAEIRRHEQQLTQLKTTLDEKRRSNRLTYIASQSFALQPILVELSGKAIKLSGATDADMVIEFTDADRSLRLQRALAWTRGFSNDEYYCLLLLKPSGLETYDELRNALTSMGFQIGIDLMPEVYSASMDARLGVKK